jgi:hypothetical protein
MLYIVSDTAKRRRLKVAQRRFDIRKGDTKSAFGVIFDQSLGPATATGA